MGTNDRYYGEALREMESGLRRDDLWGKAFSRASGDVQKAKGIYIGLLAQRLAAEDGVSEKLQLSETSEAVAEVGALAFNGGKKAFSFVFGWAVRLMVCFVVAGIIPEVVNDVYHDYKYKEEVAKLAQEKVVQLDAVRARLEASGRVITLDEIYHDTVGGTYSGMINKYGKQAADEILDISTRESRARTSAAYGHKINKGAWGLVIFILSLAGFILAARKK